MYNLNSNKQDKSDSALKTNDKTIVGAINEICDNIMENHLTIHGGLIEQDYKAGDDLKFSTIAENIPSGRYVVSCNISSTTGTNPNGGSYGYPTLVVFDNMGKAIQKIGVNQTGKQIKLDNSATLKLCAVRDTSFKIENGQLIYNRDLHIEISEKYVFSNIWVLPAHECDLDALQNTINELQTRIAALESKIN